MKPRVLPKMAPLAPAAEPRAPSLVLRLPEEVVSILLDTPSDQGLSAGSEGLGSELFFDGRGRLYQVDLELLPFSAVDLLPDAILRPATAALRDRRVRSDLQRLDSELAPLNPHAVWLSGSLEEIVVAFVPVPLTPPGSFARAATRWQLVQPAVGVTFALEASSGELRAAWIEGAFERQVLFGVELQARTHGPELMARLNALHRAYYEDLGASGFAAEAQRLLAEIRSLPAQPAASWPAALAAIEQLVEFRSRFLTSQDELDEAEDKEEDSEEEKE